MRTLRTYGHCPNRTGTRIATAVILSTSRLSDMGDLDKRLYTSPHAPTTPAQQRETHFVRMHTNKVAEFCRAWQSSTCLRRRMRADETFHVMRAHLLHLLDCSVAVLAAPSCCGWWTGGRRTSTDVRCWTRRTGATSCTSLDRRCACCCSGASRRRRLQGLRGLCSSSSSVYYKYMYCKW